VSHILELLGRGLHSDLGDVLDRFFWTPASRSLDQLRASCQQQPDKPEWHLQLGLAYLRAVQLDEAVTHLTEVCRARPDCLPARLALASAYDEKGMPDRAVEHLKIANQTHLGEPAVLFAIAFCHEKLNEPAKAAAYYRDAVAQDGTFVAARERLAAVDVLLGNLGEAIQQYEALRRGEAHEAAYRSALAHLYYQANRPQEAVEEYEAAIAMEPENWSLVDDEVEALVACGQVREAMERLRRLIDEQGPFADLHVRLGDLCSRTGDDPGAMQQYREALELQPDYLEATVKMGTQHLIGGRWDEAAEAMHRACELNDRVLASYVGMGVAQAACGRRAEAMNSFDLAAAIEPNSTLLLAEMAKLQLRSAVAQESAGRASGQAAGEAGPAGPSYDDLLHRQTQRHAEEVARHGDHADLRYRYGVLLRAQGKVPEAMKEFLQAVKLSPSYAKAWIKLGVCQQDLGLVEEAIESFQRALDIRPQFVDLHYRLGLLFTNRGNFESALRHMESAAAGKDSEQIRAALALSLQNMGLMDRVAATWRSLWQIHRPATR
jgi:tetratricopeptide (TPR) repeat protein